MDPRTSYLSSNRNSRARTKAVQPPAVSSPVGPDGSTVAGRSGAVGGSVGGGGSVSGGSPYIDPSLLPAHARGASAGGGAQSQATALRQSSNPVWAGLDNATQGQIQAGYGAGGFEGIVNSVGADDWYELPSWLRTQILAGARN